MKKTVNETLESIFRQNYIKIEHIIVDGGSVDDTIDIVWSYGSNIKKFISEPDDGIYDAMNKGISLASRDVIGILNSDDFYINEFVIEKVVKSLKRK